MTLERSCNSYVHVERLRSSGQQIALHYNNTKNELISLQTLALSSLTEKTWQKRWQILVVSHQFGRKKTNKNIKEFEHIVHQFSRCIIYCCHQIMKCRWPSLRHSAGWHQGNKEKTLLANGSVSEALLQLLLQFVTKILKRYV